MKRNLSLFRICSLIFILTILLEFLVQAEPTISSVSGTLNPRESISISGLNFGVKERAGPLKWDDFEGGITGKKIANNWNLSQGEVSGIAYYRYPLYSNQAQRQNSKLSSWHNFTTKLARESGFGLMNSAEGWKELYVSYWRRLDIDDINNYYYLDFEITGNSGTKTGYQDPGVPILSHQINYGDDSINLQADYNDPYPGIGGADIWNTGTWENNVWSRIETWVRVGDPNQALKYWQDGKLNLNYTSPKDFPWGVGPYMGDDGSSFDKIWFGYYIELASNGYTLFDDIYIDTTQARVELCNVSKWPKKDLKGGQCEIQIPTVWSSNSITFTANQGSFQDGETAYIYVVDKSGSVNENGYKIGFGEVPDIEAPVISNTQPNNELPAGTTSAILSLETNELAECRYSTIENSLFNSMTKFTNTNALQHSTLLTSLQDGKNYDSYVKCKDIAGNINAVDEKISFSIGKEQSFDFFYLVSPVNGSVYNSRRVRFVIEGEKRATYYYFDITGDSETRRILCSKCMRINKTVSFEDGYNRIVIKAVAEDGEEAEQEIEFFVDSKNPRIRRIEPRSGFMGSIFTVEYDEVNIKEVKLEYGNYATGYKTEILECPEGKNQECDIEVNLEYYDGQQIEYWFSIKDTANNYVESRHIKINVDVTDPIIKDLNYTINGRYVYFNISVDEDNLDSVEYKDWGELRPRERTLCTRLKDEICKKKVGFRYGSHELTIQVTDKAGNAVSENIFFEI